ncbi:MAG: cytochrome c family protein [Proteobacteria bacterium]|nr:cytochrome c family protein [Pseudomonadota bacterium]
MRIAVFAAAILGLTAATPLVLAQSPAPAPAAPAAPAAAPAAGDAAAGERVFAQCRACHQVGETARNTVGPQLNGLFGRQAGSVQGFNYSPAYKTPAVAEKVWSEENFATYIRDPRAVTPGTRMVFAGLRNEGQIASLVAYLKQFAADGKRTQ